MATMAFDTYRAVKDLEEAGFDESAAHVMVSVVGRAIGEGTVTKTDIRDMATRSDLTEMRSEMATQSDIAAIRSEMATKSDIAEIRSEMATQSDIAAIRSEMATKADIAAIRSETKLDIKDLEARLTTRFVWIGVVIAGLTSAVMGALDQFLG